jgi:tRNA-modifying protein YgfZ
VPDVRLSPLLDRQGAVEGTGPDAGTAAHYGSPLHEQRRLESGRGLTDLSHHEVVAVTGPERLTWLHAFTSQDLLQLAPGTATELLVLSPQGRIEHQAKVVDDGETALLLVEPGAAEPLVAFLERMRFAARVEIARRPELAVLGATRPVADVLAAVPEADAAAAPVAEATVATWTDPWPGVGAGGVAYGDDPEDAEPWVETVVHRSALRVLASLPSGVDALFAGTLAAEALRVAAHRPRFGVDTDDRSIPNELDWLRTAVHTAKGCYRGQETVAKVLNLGQPPRRLVQLDLDGSLDVLVPAGTPLLLGDREVGAVTSSAYHADLGPIALAVVRRAVPLDAGLVARVALDGARTIDVPAGQTPIVREREHGARPETTRLDPGARDVRKRF